MMSHPIASQAGDALLSAQGIALRFGATKVLHGVDFSVRQGEAVGVVGPNGAGKTTFLAALAGSLPVNAGHVHFAGRNVTALNAAQRCRLGIARSHQVPRPFGGMTVFENVLTAAMHGGRATGDRSYAMSIDALEVCGMLSVANRRAETLGLLERKRLELTRALATQPRLLLLDEIGGGLTDGESAELVDTIGQLRARGITIIWIEHIVHLLIRVTERLICMDAGAVIADGEPDAVLSDESVVRAYLGGQRS